MSKSTPNWTYEDRFQNPHSTTWICGVDEAGRGPLAGPVVAAAVILDRTNMPDGLNDSKTLSKIRRELLLNALLCSAKIGIGIAEPEEIDRDNILWASMSAMRRAVEALPVTPDIALIDGNRCPPELKTDSHAIIKGDAKSLSIAAASIVAKVTRDRIMQEADKRFPHYGFARHKGYPTRAHRDAIIQYGPCPIHRLSFRPCQRPLL